MTRLATIMLLLIASPAADAQTDLKIGYADVEYILGELPGTKTAGAEVTSLKTQLTKQLEIKQKELEKKNADFVAAEKTLPPAVRDNTIRELQMLQDNLERFISDAQSSLQKKQQDLLAPIYKEIGTAIGEVAKENGFTYILNPKVSGLDVVLYAEEKWDVSDLVLKKLGVTPKVAANDSAPRN